MNAAHGTILGLAMVMGAWACSAQQAAVPIREIARNAQLTAGTAVPVNEAAVHHPMEISAESSWSASFISRPEPMQPRTLSARFFLLNGLQLGLAIADVETTQHCIAEHHCREGNPLMPSSAAGQYSINLALVGSSALISYHLKKTGVRLWWLSPAVGAAAHTLGVATGLANR